MRNRLLLAALFLLPACATTAPSAASAEAAQDRRTVLETVQAFFDVIESGDPEAGARLVVPDGVFVNVRVEDGARVVKHFSNAEWLAGMAERTEEMYEAFDGEPLVLVDGDLAVVFGRYVFDVDGARSHVGTDAFNLVRTDEGWRISGGAYTVER